MSRYKSCAFPWACLLLAAGGAPAQPGWKPDRPVEIIVTCQPGCGPDIAARTIQKIWQSPAFCY